MPEHPTAELRMDLLREKLGRLLERRGYSPDAAAKEIARGTYHCTDDGQPWADFAAGRVVDNDMALNALADKLAQHPDAKKGADGEESTDGPYDPVAAGREAAAATKKQSGENSLAFK